MTNRVPGRQRADCLLIAAAVGWTTMTLVSGCRQPAPPPHPNRWAAAWVSALNSRSPEQVWPLMGEAATYEDPTLPRPLSGQPLIMALLTTWHRWPKLHYEIRRVTGDAQTVVVEWAVTGLRSIDAVPLQGVTLIELRGDRIERVRGYFNSLPFMAG